MSERVPKSQAAYQKGRGTTEQVLALKILIDKAITSTDYSLYILLLDMSKAFDTVNRESVVTEFLSKGIMKKWVDMIRESLKGAKIATKY